MAVAEGVDELAERCAEGVGEGVPGLEAADGAALLEFDEGASCQARAFGELVVGPSLLGPEAGEFQAECVEVGVGRGDGH